MSNPTASDPPTDSLWERRWLLAGQSVLILACLAAFIVVEAPAWHWGLFSWGVAVGLLASILIAGVGRRLARRDDVSPERRLRTRRRVVIYAAEWLLLGVLVGFLSVLTDSPWPDLLLLGALMLVTVLVAAVVAKLARRQT